MQLNITQTLGSFQFENKEQLKQHAQNILTRQGASEEVAEKIISQTIFNNEKSAINSQLAILKASSQISLNNNLKDTLKYLKNNAHKKEPKKPILGELWNISSHDETEVYNGELSDYVVDPSRNNIFAAA